MYQSGYLVKKIILQPNPASRELFLLYVLYENAQIIANYIVAKQSQETATILLVSLGNSHEKNFFFLLCKLHYDIIGSHCSCNTPLRDSARETNNVLLSPC